MKNLILLAFCLLIPRAYAGADLHLPVQELNQSAIDQLAPIGIIKVKVFPHDGAYSTPQGAETRMEVAVVKSEGGCELTMPSEGKVTMAPGTEIALKAQDFISGSGSIKCDAPMTLVREGAKAMSYRGSFALHHRNGKLIVVNLVAFNDYLKGVVPAEMSPSWPLEALKAQAVAARTYAATQILQARRSNPKNIFEIDDTVMFQAYRGLTVERATTSAAVEATDEVYLLDQAGRPIIAYFSADSGGHTESADNVWGGRRLSYTPSKPEIYDLRLVKSAWNVTFKLEEIQAKLIGRGVVPKNFKLEKFAITEWTTSGRIKKVKLNDALEVTGDKFRYGLALRSSLFKITETEKDAYRFDGLGWGHGVGMNQNGAKVLNESLGWDYKTILEFYHEGIKL